MNRNRFQLFERAADYLQKVLGVPCEIMGDIGRDVKLPYYLKAGYRFAEYSIGGNHCMMVSEENAFTADELPDGSTMVKRISEISHLTGNHAVLVLDNVDAVRRRILIVSRIGFIIPGKQAFLPFLGALLTERGMSKGAETGRRAFSPAAQVLLLWHLQRESINGSIISDIARRFPYSVKTVSGAAKELERAGVCTIEGDNSGKYLQMISKDEIWDRAYHLMTTPIQEVLYCDDVDLIPSSLRFVTYDKAMAEYTFLADFSKEAVAVYKNDDAVRRLKNEGVFNRVEGRCRVELWKYNPALLSEGNVVDALSLALCYRGTDDERVSGELNNLVKTICKD